MLTLPSGLNYVQMFRCMLQGISEGRGRVSLQEQKENYIKDETLDYLTSLVYRYRNH